MVLSLGQNLFKCLQNGEAKSIEYLNFETVKTLVASHKVVQHSMAVLGNPCCSVTRSYPRSNCILYNLGETGKVLRTL